MNGKPIANKYREGKMKRTLKKELKDLKPLRRKVWNPANPVGRRRSRSALGTYGWRHPQSVVHRSERQDEVRTLNSSRKRTTPEGIFWFCQNEFQTTVLKHGPRSLIYMRVCECKTHKRNESESEMPIRKEAASAFPDLLWRVWARACMLRPERWRSMLE